MNTSFLAAALLLVLIGLVHSLLGEKLIFRRMRQGGFIPTQGGSALREPHVRILWASWHVLTLFGWAMAAMLLRLSSAETPHADVFLDCIATAMLAGAMLVLFATRGRHPGWLGLSLVAMLIWFA